jgi:glycosyltransferase involved in cell wall biosynthesis
MSLMTGGLQVQAVETWKALLSLGGEMSAELFDWSKAETPADLYHFVSLTNFGIAELVRKAGRPYVYTMLLCGVNNALRLRVRAARRLLKSTFLARTEPGYSLVRAACVVTITEADATAAHIIFGVEKAKIEVVSNGVADAFFKCTPEAWHINYGEKEFVMCVGAVQPRKNQLLLAQVCNRLQLPLVLLGPVSPGETEYAQRVSDAMRENGSLGGRWLQNLRNEDELLLSAYAACRVFVLLSSVETQPLSVMQAMAARKPVLLRKADYAQDNLFRHLPQIASEELPAVAEAVKTVWENGRRTELSPDFGWDRVARRLQTIYGRVMCSS